MRDQKNSNFISENDINLVFEEDLTNDYFKSFESKLDKNFRDGFWVRTSSRFLLIKNYVEKTNLCNFFHIENDVFIIDDLRVYEDNEYDRAKNCHHFTPDDHRQLGWDLGMVFYKLLITTQENRREVEQAYDYFFDKLHGQKAQ